MSKFKCAVVLFCVWFAGLGIARARAEAPQSFGDGRVILSFETNLEISGKYLLVLKGGEFYLDDQRMTESELLRLGPQLSEVLTVTHDRAADPQCSAGHYDHRVEIGGKFRSSSGCLDDARFAALSGAFRAMRQGRSLIGEKVAGNGAH